MRWLQNAAIRKVAYPVVMAVLGALVDGGYSGSRGVSRRSRRSASRGQTVRIVIEQPTVTSAQRPEVGVMERTKKERRF